MLVSCWVYTYGISFHCLLQCRAITQRPKSESYSDMIEGLQLIVFPV